MVKLATQNKPFFSNDLEEKLRRIAALGFHGFEADGVMLLEDFDTLKRAVRDTHVPITSVCGGYRGWIGDFNDYRRKTAIADIKLILSRAGELGARGIVVPAAWGMFSLRLPPMAPPRPAEEDTRVLIDSLMQLEDTCAQTGTMVLLEPLNRYEDHMLNTLDAAARVIDAGGLKHTLITADFFHMNIEEADIAAGIRKYGSKIGHVHIADSHRCQPGSGHIDFMPGFKALHETGFDGTMAFECRVLGDDQEGAYARSVGYILERMARAGL